MFTQLMEPKQGVSPTGRYFSNERCSPVEDVSLMEDVSQMEAVSPLEKYSQMEDVSPMEMYSPVKAVSHIFRNGKVFRMNNEPLQTATMLYGLMSRAHNNGV